MPISALKTVSKLLPTSQKHLPLFLKTKKTYGYIHEGIRNILFASQLSDYQKVIKNIIRLRIQHSEKFPDIVEDGSIIIDEKKLRLGVNEPRRIPYASGWELFKGSFFGRDSARIAQDRLLYDPAFSKDVILALASMQGTKRNRLSEEEPGKIHHEWRSDVINGRHVAKKQRDIIAQLGPLMGGNDKTFTSYVSADATLSFLETVYLYIEKTGDTSILKCTYFDKDAKNKKNKRHRHTIQYAVEKATEWVAETIIYGPLLHNPSKKRLPSTVPRLFSWQHTNEKGVHNQTLRDSEEAEFHPNGEKANHNAPRIDTGMQAIAYDVLKKGGTLLKRNDWKNLAGKLQTSVLQYLWMSNKQYFVQGLDYHPHTKKIRQIKTLCANVGELLNSDILLDLPERSSKRYIEGIVRMLFSKEFLTTYGIRTQGVGHINALQVKMPDGQITRMTGYHGPETVWPVINGKISDGLEHVGLYGLAENIKTRISNTFQLVGYHAEFINVGEKEQLGIHQEHLDWGVTDKNYEFHGTNVPELIQGWSWSLHEKVQYQAKQQKQKTNPFSWQYTLEKELLDTYQVKPLLSLREVRKMRSKTVIAPINTIYGRAVQQVLFQKWNAKGMIQLYK